MASEKTLVYVVEDSIASGTLYCSYLEAEGYETRHFVEGHAALVAIKERMPDVVVQDVCLPDISGLEVLRFINRQSCPARVVIVTANSSIDVAVDAMRLGGFDFIEKPFSKERLLSAVDGAQNQLKVDISPDAGEKTAVPPRNSVREKFIGDSLAMSTVFKVLDSAAKSKASVFVTGESGTGKEVCAVALHEASARHNGPFIAINCAAIPADLFESEIFGHEKGAFSGAVSQRKGAAELADGGTLFLDELCEMDLNLQAKLLRFLQTGTFSRVGGQKVMHSDIRIVCATNRDPAKEVGEGRFREDLYYRLNVIPVQLPPLRDRADDALLLARYFLKLKAEENQKAFADFDEAAVDKIRRYDWPGNIRELQNIIENIVVINNGDVVTADMLTLINSNASSAGSGRTTPGSAVPLAATVPQPVAPTSNHQHDQVIRPLWQVERDAIEDAIRQCDGNIPLAAAWLGVSASTIYRKKKSWGEGGQPVEV
ncbi:sigma-54-dependent Fis family transcriptional regulator [Spongiibacter sp. KMU-166]|uniref:Sigma-54-dependent Fis family transcriptional regulator n=1 Tax=Spongiibacter thalassae TaxID=2721624 RepID=A0ABX1GLK4_9GAMM|nr:sigma-54 dependent transcriptional regulator [Spongiibacter thalassae]NKI19358.1 sigma-54-dependent Fis family transcriptional regulator [Spongiibacter thalassae]